MCAQYTGFIILIVMAGFKTGVGNSHILRKLDLQAHQQDIQLHKNICPGEVAAPEYSFLSVLKNNTVYLDVECRENIRIPSCPLPELHGMCIAIMWKNTCGPGL